MPMTVNSQANPAEQLAQAYQSGDAEQMTDAWQATIDSIAQRVRGDFEAYQLTHDDEVLAQRGYRQLTKAEQRFYERLTAASRAGDAASAQQAFLDVTGEDADDDLMPVTIIEDVFRDLEKEHPLLQVIKFTYTGYATKWIRNKHEYVKAVWGKITGSITKELTSDLEIMAIDQNKLSAFLVIPLDILDMGYTFIDAYARRVLMEAVADGLEAGIIHGNGIDSPVGLDRNVSANVSINATTGYPKKTAIKVDSFEMLPYLDTVAKLAKTESGKDRTFAEVVLICSMTDYLTKIRPASTVLTPTGYLGDLFPFATKVITSAEMTPGEAIMMVPDCYTFCVGGKRNGIIETDDSFKFLDDARTYKIIQHGDGIADDNTSAILLDISDLSSLIMPVRVEGEVTTVTKATESAEGDSESGTPKA